MITGSFRLTQNVTDFDNVKPLRWMEMSTPETVSPRPAPARRRRHGSLTNPGLAAHALKARTRGRRSRACGSCSRACGAFVFRMTTASSRTASGAYTRQRFSHSTSPGSVPLQANTYPFAIHDDGIWVHGSSPHVWEHLSSSIPAFSSPVNTFW
jgi:hypothetical protein